MMTRRPKRRLRRRAPPRAVDGIGVQRLTFAPAAWLRWQYLCHAGPTEVAAFGLSAIDDLLYLDDLLVVRQRATPVTVALDDGAVADLFDRMADAGVGPERFARVWLHTHPGTCPGPSGTDEETFARAFGGCDWAVLAILARGGRTYARLRFAAGPGGAIELLTAVDWAAWPASATDTTNPIAAQVATWEQEYATLVERVPLLPPSTSRRDAVVVDRCFDPFFPGAFDACDGLEPGGP